MNRYLIVQVGSNDSVGRKIKLRGDQKINKSKRNECLFTIFTFLAFRLTSGHEMKQLLLVLSCKVILAFIIMSYN